MGLKERSRSSHSKRRPTPVWLIVCEGRNKTEKNYINSLVCDLRKLDISVRIKPSEDTSPEGMIKKALEIAQSYGINAGENGDRIICLMDSDLSDQRISKILSLKKDYPKIEIFISTPCFETWFLLHFVKNPKRCVSSKKAKTELTKYIPNYSESLDVYSKVPQIKHDVQNAIENSEAIRNNYLNKQIDVYSVDANPYTEIDILVKEILSHINS